MQETREKSQQGLPWPEAFAAIQTVIRDQWQVGDEIYLTRQLSNDIATWTLFLADVTTPAFSGQAVLKLGRVGDPVAHLESETERFRLASQTAPDYAATHLPQIINVAHTDDSVAILSSIPGRSLDFALPWSDCSHEQQKRVLRQVSRALLEDWNAAAELAPGLLSPHDLLRGWLGDRLEPDVGNLQSLMAEGCGVPADEPSMSFEGQWYPNPLAFAVGAAKTVDHLRLRAVRGNVHGHLSGYNVLVSKTGDARDHYYLIDLSHYENSQFLFFDHGYFALSHLLAKRRNANSLHWQAILDQLCPFDHMRTGSSPRSEDIGLLDILRSLRQEVFDWVDRNHAHRLSNMESQFQLAQVAVGLTMANRQVAERDRRLAVLYAAAILKDYLVLNDVVWPKHGPDFSLDEKAPSSPTPSLAASPVTEPSGVWSVDHPTKPEKPSVAVLAFENHSGDPQLVYVADGIAEQIIEELVRIDWLMVVARASTFAYKGQTIDARTVGKELGVNYVVDGVIRRSGDQIKVTVELIDTRDGRQLWTEHYYSQLDESPSVQDDMVAAIVGKIDAKLKSCERERAERKRGAVGLWDMFQRGMWHFHRITEDNSQIARQHLSNVVKLAPTFAGAHAALALLETRRIYFAEPDELERHLAFAFKHAVKAVELDGNSSIARMALSRAYAFQGNQEQAIEEAEMATALNPSSSNACLNLAGTLLWTGHAEEALPAINKAIRLSPLDPLMQVKIFVKGFILYLLNDDSEAEKTVGEAEISASLAPFVHLILSAILVRQEKFDEARAAIATVSELKPQLTLAQLRSSWHTLAPRYRDKLLSDIEAAGLTD
ncbi:MAG: hypothetical protein AAF563_16985 [Pseudomonadota bacterium]